MKHNICKIIHSEITKFINNNDFCQLYIYIVFLDKCNYFVNYDYILDLLLKKNKIKIIYNLCKYTYLNICIKSNLSKIKKYISNDKIINSLIKVCNIFNEKNLLPTFNWDTYHNYLLILTNLQIQSELFPLFIINIIKSLNINQTNDTDVIYMFYTLLKIPEKEILKFVFNYSNCITSKIFNFNFNYCFNILDKKNDSLNSNHFYYLNECIFKDCFNDNYLNNFQKRSIFNQMIDEDNNLRYSKKQRLN